MCVCVCVCVDLVEPLQHGAIVLHVLHYICPLAFIRSDDSNLFWTDACFHQLSDHLLNIYCLHPKDGEQERRRKGEGDQLGEE